MVLGCLRRSLRRNPGAAGRKVIPYGREAEQYGELWLPHGTGPHPVAVVIHGGFWRRRYGCGLMRPLSAALAAQGVAAWNVEYRRVGSPGGGWPGTLLDVAAAVDHLRHVAAGTPDTEGQTLDLARVGVIGHSAGGHLAVWAAGRRSLRHGDPGAGPEVQPVAAVSLAGVLDLADAAGRGLGGGAVPALLGGSPTGLPDRYRVASPAERLPVGVSQLLVHGDRDGIVPAECSRRFQERARAAGDDVTLSTQPRVGHFEVIDPRHPAGRAGLDWLAGRLVQVRPG
ncbi:MAG: alpha/beta hydrolase [Candidatus Dormibacteraeota bacterium]|nr:alpha/beta hydrolase [Candidatus Dormibacteraeota bacterium]